MPRLRCRARGHGEVFCVAPCCGTGRAARLCAETSVLRWRVGVRRARCLRVDRAGGRSCLRRCRYEAACRRGPGSEFLRDHPIKSRKRLVMGCRGASPSNRSTPLRPAGCIITTDHICSVTVLAHKLKTPVTHRTRSRLAAAMRATAATTARHGHIGTFEWRGPSRTVRVRLLGRLKRVKRAGVSRSKLNVRYCS